MGTPRQGCLPDLHKYASGIEGSMRVAQLCVGHLDQIDIEIRCDMKESHLGIGMFSSVECNTGVPSLIHIPSSAIVGG